MTERYRPENSLEVKSKISGAVVYLFRRTENGPPCAMFYVGRSAKGKSYRFVSEAKRAEYVRKWLIDTDAGHVAHEARKAGYRAERSKPHALKVGDVLYSSWGYEQTNIDFYQVTRLVGKASVAIREISQERVESVGFMQGDCVPLVDSFKGDEMVKRVNGLNNSVRITSYACAYPAEKNANGLGYKPHHYTEYA